MGNAFKLRVRENHATSMETSVYFKRRIEFGSDFLSIDGTRLGANDIDGAELVTTRFRYGLIENILHLATAGKLITIAGLRGKHVSLIPFEYEHTIHHAYDIGTTVPYKEHRLYIYIGGTALMVLIVLAALSK